MDVSFNSLNFCRILFKDSFLKRVQYTNICTNTYYYVPYNILCVLHNVPNIQDLDSAKVNDYVFTKENLSSYFFNFN